MKLKHRLFPNLKRFKKNPQKTYIKKYKFYPSFMYSKLDKWLKSMSQKGWHIVDCGLLWYLFECGAPCEKEYFTYSEPSFRSNGYFSIILRHPNLDSVYGVKKRKSKINANEGKARHIIEIDLHRIDPQNDVGYIELINDRNRLHLLSACIVLIFIALVILLSILVFLI